MKKFAVLLTALFVVAGFTSCKPKQSAYRAVYEKAKQRDIAENQDDEIVPIVKTGESAAVVKEKITPAQGEDGTGLRAFSVVIGSFQNITNAKSLKERMTSEGYRALLAQNEKGMFRVIVSSFDSKDEAVSSRESIKAKYAPLFQDAWILQRTF